MAVRKDHIDTSWGSCFNWNLGVYWYKEQSGKNVKGPIMSYTILEREKDASAKPK